MQVSERDVDRAKRCLATITDLGEPPELRQRERAIERAAAAAESGQDVVFLEVLISIAEGAPDRGLARPDMIIRDLTSRDQLVRAALRYLQIKPEPGWSAAARRGRALDSLLQQLTARLLRLAAIEEPLDLMLRGSGGQGIPTRASDIDFELSGPGFPAGHPRIERAIATLLEGLGLDAEGSSGRPTKRDLESSDGSCRELHEWMELRRAGQPGRDLGWLSHAFADLPADWWRRPSAYELEGRRATPKYAFFEARTLTARLSLLHDTGVGTTRGQLRALRQIGLHRPVMQIEHAIVTALNLYERPEPPDEARLRAAQESLARLREQFALPGPDLTRPPSPDTRRETAAVPPPRP